MTYMPTGAADCNWPVSPAASSADNRDVVKLTWCFTASCAPVIRIRRLDFHNAVKLHVKSGPGGPRRGRSAVYVGLCPARRASGWAPGTPRAGLTCTAHLHTVSGSSQSRGDLWGDDDNAVRYDDFARLYPMYQQTSHDLILLASPALDAVVVDLACGTGATTAAILSGLGPEGKVIGIDRTSATGNAPRLSVRGSRSPSPPRCTYLACGTTTGCEFWTRRTSMSHPGKPGHPGGLPSSPERPAEDWP